MEVVGVGRGVGVGAGVDVDVEADEDASAISSSAISISEDIEMLGSEVGATTAAASHSTGQSSKGGRKRELDTKPGPSQRPIVVYRWYTDMELRCYRFGFHIQCRSSVGGSPSPQNFQKTPEFSRRKAEAQ